MSLGKLLAASIVALFLMASGGGWEAGRLGSVQAAEDGHTHGGEHGHSDGGHESKGQGKGKQSMGGGRGHAGHSSGDDGHKGNSSHGGGSKTLEAVIMNAEESGSGHVGKKGPGGH